MKYILSAILLTLFISCKENKPQASEDAENKVEKTIDDPNWLLGDWQRANDKEGNSTYEYWDKNKHGQFVSLGLRLKGQDTTWKETVLLHKVDDTWKFEVSIEGDTLPTIFEVLWWHRTFFDA